MARRRRRQKNPLLVRILIFSLVAHAIALPIAAHYGAFDKLKQEFGTSRVVMITVPPVEEPKKRAPEKPKKAPKTTPERHAKSSAPKATAAQKTNLPQPKVVASAATGADAGGGPTVNPNGTGPAGVLPTAPATVAPTAPKPAAPEPKPEAAQPKAIPAPEPKSTTPATPTPAPVTTPKPRRIVEAEAEFAPQPEIPDDLRAQPFEKTLVVEADVDTGGHPINVRVVDSTGNKELDGVGLDTARRYRFRPATVDDAPVSEHIRFRIIFKVE
jgi:protein TonB